MKNLKELQPILAAIYCINRTGSDDEDIRRLVDYAFKSILGNTTNLLLAACVGKTKKDVMPEPLQLLKEDTNYLQYLEGLKK